MDNTHNEKIEFNNISFADQAKALNNQVLSLEKALAVHIKLAKAEGKNLYDLKEKYIIQLEKVIKTLS